MLNVINWWWLFVHLSCGFNKPSSPTRVNHNNNDELVWECQLVRGKRAHLPVFVTYRTYFLASGCLPVDKMPWQHSTTLHQDLPTPPQTATGSKPLTLPTCHVSFNRHLSFTFLFFINISLRSVDKTTIMDGCFSTQNPLSLSPSPWQPNLSAYYSEPWHRQCRRLCVTQKHETKSRS